VGICLTYPGQKTAPLLSEYWIDLKTLVSAEEFKEFDAGPLEWPPDEDEVRDFKAQMVTEVQYNEAWCVVAFLIDHEVGRELFLRLMGAFRAGDDLSDIKGKLFTEKFLSDFERAWQKFIEKKVLRKLELETVGGRKLSPGDTRPPPKGTEGFALTDDSRGDLFLVAAEPGVPPKAFAGEKWWMLKAWGVPVRFYKEAWKRAPDLMAGRNDVLVGGLYILITFQGADGPDSRAFVLIPAWAPLSAENGLGARLGESAVKLVANAKSKDQERSAGEKTETRAKASGVGVAADRDSTSGRIVDAAGRPVAGARVLAFEELAPPSAGMGQFLRAMTGLKELMKRAPAEAVSDREGRFDLGGLAPFWYTVRVVARGHGAAEAKEVAMPGRGLTIALGPASQLRGTVSDGSGEPIAGALVMAYQDTSGWEHFETILAKARPPMDQARTDASGAFRFDTLGPGVYNFLVTARGFQKLTKMKVQVKPGINPVQALTMTAGKTIQGVVLGPEGEPVVGAHARAVVWGKKTSPGPEVRLEFGDGGVSTDGTGQFALEDLEDEKHLLLIWHQDYMSAQWGNLAPGDATLTVRLSRGIRLTGKIFDASTRKPITAAAVSVGDLAELRKEGVSDDSGRYRVEGLGAARKPVEVRVHAEGYGRQKRAIDLTRAEGLVQQDFELERCSLVSGTVHATSDKKPIEGAWVEVRARAGDTSSSLGEALTDGRGHFEVPNVDPTEIAIVRITADGCLEAESAAFRVSSGGEVALPAIHLVAGGCVSGRVVDANGRGVFGCLVILTAGDPAIPAKADLTWPCHARTDLEGRFLHRGLRGGSYVLKTKARGYVERSLPEVKVAEGATTSLNDIVLQAGPKPRES
jgi:hypothetical protein